MRPIQGVLFDLHSTLVDQGDPDRWLALAEAASGSSVDGPQREGLTAFLARVWGHASEFDPDNERDISAEGHREVFGRLMDHRYPELDPRTVQALYETITDAWTAYDDSIPMLTELKALGIRTALVSNAGIDIRPVLVRTGIQRFLDAEIISGEHGIVKPGPAIFELALDRIDVEPEDALMVGDSFRDDSGAAAIGVRTLLLPRTSGSVHGLDAVAALVRASRTGSAC
ncbi:MAG: HAD family hydrolase [Candidatus Nanopelagicales bacterium]|nr:HAD family hydrolase [Candidatus Nanopelagicales bacterium]MDZ4249824.1 HAD family hydrolase [Candidatus Nanopelagicales bacterium]